MTDLDGDQVRRFFETAQERQLIHMRRSAGREREAWTADPVFQRYHFCNVFRCDDRVSGTILSLARAWGDPWRAALAGRLVNRHGTVLRMHDLGRPAEPGELRQLIKEHGLNTNAYRLNTPLGLNNLEGVVLMYERGQALGPQVLSSADVLAAMEAMGQVERLGAFVRYQIVLDLIEMNVFGPRFSDDRAFPGLGAGRGAMRMLGREISGSWEVRRSETYDESLVQGIMSQLLILSRRPENWPRPWRPWTIHEVEGWLCEYDKYARRANNESAGGRRFKGPYAGVA